LTCFFAAKGGHLDILKYAHEKGCPWDVETTCCYAAQEGHLEYICMFCLGFSQFLGSHERENQYILVKIL
jgi:hypothetical protein